MALDSPVMRAAWFASSVLTEALLLALLFLLVFGG